MAELEQMTELLKTRGFDSIEKVLEALDTTKADLTKHKTRAESLTTLQSVNDALLKEKREREDAEKSEAQKLADAMKTLQTDNETLKTQAAAATRMALLERGISENIGTVHESIRPFAVNYLRTILPAKEWADTAGLTLAITESLAEFTALAPEQLKIVPGGGQPKRSGAEPPKIQDSKTGFSYLEAVFGKPKS